MARSDLIDEGKVNLCAVSSDDTIVNVYANHNREIGLKDIPNSLIIFASSES